MNRVLSAFVNGAVLSFALTALVSLILRLIPRHVLNAATRYVLWWVTLTIALALPALYLPMPQFHAPPPPVATRPAPIQAAPIMAPTFAPIAIATPDRPINSASTCRGRFRPVSTTLARLTIPSMPHRRVSAAYGGRAIVFRK